MHLSFSPSQKQSQCIAWMRSLLESLSCLLNFCFGKPSVCFLGKPKHFCGKPNFVNQEFGKPCTLSLSLTCLVDVCFPSDFGQRA